MNKGMPASYFIFCLAEPHRWPETLFKQITQPDILHPTSNWSSRWMWRNSAFG
jgi:hypothetical protein